MDIASAEIPAPAEEPCRPLEALDTSGDGRLTGADRYWRFLFLLPEGASSPTEESVVSLYESGVRALDFGRRSYANDRQEEESLRSRGEVVLSRVGKGERDARLVLDASRVSRSGDVRVVTSAGTALEGLQIVDAEMALEGVDGRSLALCSAAP